MKIRIKSIRESHWGQYSDDNCWDQYDILMNHDAVDFCEMCNSSEGSAIADQLCDILTGEEELKDQNPNALEYIKQFCERKGEVDLAGAIAKYLEDEGQDGTLDEFMESKDSNKSFKEATDWTEYSPNCFIHNVKDGVVRREKSDFHNGWYVQYEKDGSVQDEKDFGDNEELAKNYADKLVKQYSESKKSKKESFADSDPVYEELYNKYVPGVGKANTVLGEVLRACSQVIYRWYNDGDQFNEDYGVETAGSSAMYLMYHQPVQSIAKIVKSEGDTTFNYGSFIEHLEQALIDLCHNESEVSRYAAQSNGIDSRSDFIRDAEKEFPQDEWE